MVYFISAAGVLAWTALWVSWWWYGTLGDIGLALPVGSMTIAAILLAVFLVLVGAGVA